MELQQKRTFLPYLRGINPEALRLGNLYINPLEPTDGLASKRFEYARDIEDQAEYEKKVKKWCWREEPDQPFTIRFEASQGGSMGLSMSDFIRLGAEKSKSIWATIEGKSGRRMKLRDPEAFLEEVMTQDGIDAWIRRHASITYKSRFGLNRWQAPELWMCTGVQHVTGGEVQFEGNSSSKVSAEGGGDAGPAIGAPPGILKARAEASHEKSNGAKNEFGHEDERVWAAQFMPITIEFGAQQDTELSARTGQPQPQTIRDFRLDDVRDLKARGIRASQERDSQPREPVPKLIGRVTVRAARSIDSDAIDPEGLAIDDKPYVASIQDADWESYDAYSKALKSTQTSKERSAERRRNS